jgi:AmmeMemoRadiSam system protein B
MGIPQRPQLRPYLEPAQDFDDPHHVYLMDQLGLNQQPARVTVREFHWIRLFDGQRTLPDIHSSVGGEVQHLHSLVQRLDDNLCLEGPRFRQVVDQAVRPPRCIGVYPEDPSALRRLLDSLFTGRDGPGKPGSPRPDGQLRAAFIPHIDYARGGVSYGWAFKEVFEHTDARLFVIIGTSHYSSHRFTLTRKDFETPLGIVPTDQAYIDRLVRAYGASLFDDELRAHLPEHSIELEVVLLQYLYQGRRDIRIVPMVVGSFQDCVDRGRAPLRHGDIGRMIEALRRVEAETPEPICYIISGDLAHIGPKFGELAPVTAAEVAASRRQDEAIMDKMKSVDSAGFFQMIAAEGDRRRICGLPPAYTVLEAIRPRRGKLLYYDQYVHPRGHESVSFASMAFYR